MIKTGKVLWKILTLFHCIRKYICTSLNYVVFTFKFLCWLWHWNYLLSVDGVWNTGSLVKCAFSFLVSESVVLTYCKKEFPVYSGILEMHWRCCFCSVQWSCRKYFVFIHDNILRFRNLSVCPWKLPVTILSEQALKLYHEHPEFSRLWWPVKESDCVSGREEKNPTQLQSCFQGDLFFNQRTSVLD